MRSLGENPWKSISETASAQQKIIDEFDSRLKELSHEHGRENVVMALEGIAFDIKNRNMLNTYDIPDEIFDELMHVKDEYDIEIHTNGHSPEEFAETVRVGNPLMASQHQWPSVEQWEKAWDSVKELRDEEGDIIYKVFFDLVLFTEAGYHEREKFVEKIMEEIS